MEQQASNKKDIKLGLELLNHEIRFKIFSLLNMYPELNFTELSEKLNKSKSTIHPHIQKLIDVELIHVSREEQVRGKFSRKYYSLVPDIFEKTRKLDIVTTPDDLTRELAEKMILNGTVWMNSLIEP